MKIFTQNAKMKKSSKTVYNFGIPAFIASDGTKTCPNAGNCAAGCYARQGAYLWGPVKVAYQARLDLTKNRMQFVNLVQLELDKLIKKNKQLYIRVHDSGDFYSEEYQITWYVIAAMNPNVRFYAYTKQIEQSKRLEHGKPSNFDLIYSYGGKQDALIDQAKDRFSKVFELLAPSDYVDASNDDMLALTENKKIALIYHGAKSYKNTKWNDQKSEETCAKK